MSAGRPDGWFQDATPGLLRSTVGPASLLFVCPCAVNAIAYCVKELDGSLYALAEATAQPDFFAKAFPLPTPAALRFLGGLLLLQLALLQIVPGERFNGPRTAFGHIPTYTDNGFRAFFCTLAALGMISSCTDLLPATVVYDELGPIMTTLNAGALLLSLSLYVKGLVAPSTSDSGTTGSLMMDLYWGTELYPRVFDVDFKQLFIARYGIVLWCLFAVSFACKSSELQREVAGEGGGGDGDGGGFILPPNGQLVSATLMVVYIAKFFYWEKWYMHAADIQVDRFGFMMCWGPICFMPLVHTLQNLYMVNNTGLVLSNSVAAGYLVVGNLMTYANYEADTQRHRVRASDGACTVWGKPAAIIRAKYTTADGKVHAAVLSCCGFNGLSRQSTKRDQLGDPECALEDTDGMF